MNDKEKQEREKDRLKKMSDLVKAVRFNHDKSGKLRAVVNQEKEIEKYMLAITQLSLPHRFGMYKTLKNNAKKKKIKLKVPKTDIPDEHQSDPNHKVRPIFPLDD